MEMLEPLRASHQSQAFLMCSGLHTWGHLVTVPSTCDAQADCLMEELSGTAKEAPRSQVQEGPSADQSELQGPSTPDQEADAMAICFERSSEMSLSRDCSQSGVCAPADTQPDETEDEALLRHMREQEVQWGRRPDPLYFNSIQKEVNPKMRAIVIDWLVEVAEEWKLCSDTLFLAVNLMDRYLSVCAVTRDELQLVGAACLWIASKYEELQPPTASDFVFIADETYSRAELLAQEQHILGTLGYSLTVATAKGFLRVLLGTVGADKTLYCLSSYLCELSLLDHSMLRYLPSEVAASCMHLARVMLRRPGWDTKLGSATRHTPASLSPCVLALGVLHAAQAESTQLCAVRDKYAASHFRSVAVLVPPYPSLTAECMALMGAWWSMDVAPTSHAKAAVHAASNNGFMTGPIIVADLASTLPY